MSSAGAFELGAWVMRGDKKAKIFVGSSSEGMATAEIIASALKGAGMNALLWSEFFKTRDPPLQELDRQKVGVAGAVLVGSADDRVISRGGEERAQMRDNVLFEYGLFSGRLGRHRCILLMPDHPRFRIPSDFLGVAGFILYTAENLNEKAEKVAESLHAALTADGFKRPSLRERCRRLLLLSGWVRNEIAKVKPAFFSGSWKELLGEKIDAVLCFLKEDTDRLKLSEDAELLKKLVRESIGAFPYIPDRREIRDRLKRAFYALRDPSALHHESDSRRGGGLMHLIEEMLGPDEVKLFDYDYDRGRARICPWCNRFQECQDRVGLYIPGFWTQIWPYSDTSDCVFCAGHAWCLGAGHMFAVLGEQLGELDRTISSVDRWQKDWVPAILEQLAEIEKKVHEKIFGHL
jgi:hypothetical protein